MKHLFWYTCVLFLCLGFNNNAYCINDWIPYNSSPLPPQVYVPQYPTLTYSTQETYMARPMIWVYQWVPYYSTKTYITERHGLLCKYRTVIHQPVIEWVYQPVLK